MINYSNKSDVLLAVAQDAELLQFLPKELGNDRDIFLAALKTRNVKSVFQFLPDILKHDRQFILAATEIAERSVLPYIRDEFKKDKEILLATLKKELVFTFHGYVSDALRNDPEFMLSAIGIHGFALTFASDELKKMFPLFLNS